MHTSSYFPNSWHLCMLAAHTRHSDEQRKQEPVGDVGGIPLNGVHDGRGDVAREVLKGAGVVPRGLLVITATMLTEIMTEKTPAGLRKSCHNGLHLKLSHDVIT